MDYLETKIYTTTAGTEPVCALLMRYGVNEVSVEDRADLQTIIDAKDWLGWDYVSDELTEKGSRIEDSDDAKCPVKESSPGAGVRDIPEREAAATFCTEDTDAGSDIPECEVVVTFYTEDTDAGRGTLSEIKMALMVLKGDEQYGEYGSCADFGRLYAESAPLTDEWKEKWKESFRRFRASKRIVVTPSWESEGTDSPIEPGDVVITIDPGMAFGTGTHETTSMCLVELDRTVRPGMSVLDIGAGSGILSIAASLLGAGAVTAIEYDDDAASVAAENFLLNGVRENVKLIRGDIREHAADLGAYDVVIANLTSGLVKQIAEMLHSVTKRDGRLIVSGLLDHEEQEVKAVLERAGFVVNAVQVSGEWLALCADFS
ncbi:MAG: 50S ribosomal protein L11 methyltransferase [Clostridiales Family XIII bacterium]|jgi:ribosomal protein L11 methyltransferase|nr:50S ribosomal protein L11 methyltransferase [Clostridiales Family XIII bacterium]